MEGRCIAGRWTLTKLLGAGSFGQIYVARDAEEDREVAVKLEVKATKHPQLVYEAKLLRHLQGGRGISEVYHFGIEASHTVLVMELMGPSLEDCFNLCNRKIPLKSVLMLADQMLLRIEYLHSKHYIHRDIKPDNFLIGRGQLSNIVYIIDFGLAKKYRDAQTLKHGPYRENKNLTGTARYASLNAHLGLEQSRRDDLEAIGFVLVYFLKGSLPWQGVKATARQDKYAAIMEMKMNMSFEELCGGIPRDFVTYLDYARNLAFDEEPDYRYARWIFRNLYRMQKYDVDGCFEWNVVRPRPLSEAGERREARLKGEAARPTAASTAPTSRANPGDLILSIGSEP